MTELKLVRYHRRDGWYSALIEKGRKWIHCIWLDGKPLRVRKVRVAEEKYMVDYPHPIAPALGNLSSVAIKRGASKQAQSMIDRAIKSMGSSKKEVIC